MDQIY